MELVSFIIIVVMMSHWRFKGLLKKNSLHSNNLTVQSRRNEASRPWWRCRFTNERLDSIVINCIATKRPLQQRMASFGRPKFYHGAAVYSDDVTCSKVDGCGWTWMDAHSKWTTCHHTSSMIHIKSARIFLIQRHFSSFSNIMKSDQCC